MPTVNITVVQVYADNATIGVPMMAMIFSILFVPHISRYRTAFWDILKMIALRELIADFGKALIARYEWVLLLLLASLLNVDAVNIDIGLIGLFLLTPNANKS